MYLYGRGFSRILLVWNTIRWQGEPSQAHRYSGNGLDATINRGASTVVHRAISEHACSLNWSIVRVFSNEHRRHITKSSGLHNENLSVTFGRLKFLTLDGQNFWIIFTVHNYALYVCVNKYRILRSNLKIIHYLFILFTRKSVNVKFIFILE